MLTVTHLLFSWLGPPLYTRRQPSCVGPRGSATRTSSGHESTTDFIQSQMLTVTHLLFSWLGPPLYTRRQPSCVGLRGSATRTSSGHESTTDFIQLREIWHALDLEAQSCTGAGLLNF